MDKLKLIHTKDKFVLELNDTPIHFVTGYKLEADVEKEGILDLTVKMSIDMEESSIDIDNKETNLI